MGSGINTTFRQVGIATGVAGLGAIFQSQVDSKLAELLPHAPAGLGESSPPAARERSPGCTCRRRSRPRPSHAADVAFVSGFNEIILIAAIVSFVGAALGFALVRSRDFVAAGRRRRDRAGRGARPAAH